MNTQIEIVERLKLGVYEFDYTSKDGLPSHRARVTLMGHDDIRQDKSHLVVCYDESKAGIRSFDVRRITNLIPR